LDGDVIWYKDGNALQKHHDEVAAAIIRHLGILFGAIMSDGDLRHWRLDFWDPLVIVLLHLSNSLLFVSIPYMVFTTGVGFHLSLPVLLGAGRFALGKGINCAIGVYGYSEPGLMI
jgi:hypothetical protein